MLHIVLADGFEEIEALATIDILRRCGLEVQIISVTGKRLMVGAHNIPVQADSLLR
uniref:DJ-1/PfpI family protein n=1 Tax=Alloprevotella sp. TaxID=1872471 RepID=UPI004028C792